MSPEPKDGCAVHIQRLDLLEGQAEKDQASHHKLVSTVTGLTMKTDLQSVEHEHLKRDFWSNQKASEARTSKNADAAADMLAAQTKQLLSFEKLSSKTESTERVLKWVLAVVTSVGVGTAVIVLSQIVRTQPQ